MRPLKLTLAGFRSYSKEQSITFDNKGLFAIIGDTGAGKSTILEGIVFALYNASTWDERNSRSLISDGAANMSVRLEFEAEGRNYRITRCIFKENYSALFALTGGIQ